MDRIRNRPGLEALDVRGIHNTTVILDIDGTITGDGQVFFSESVLAKIRELASCNVVYVFSNHRNNTRKRIVASRVGCTLIETPHRKPSPRNQHSDSLQSIISFYESGIAVLPDRVTRNISCCGDGHTFSRPQPRSGAPRFCLMFYCSLEVAAEVAEIGRILAISLREQ